ncbi:hypothetical protein B0H14DRAFT_2593644 [Mycena olivaceomarginata]|nr:hypothetical protein B0H14DRAFT_2593644 [Mycena olivaceomarginata]
MSLPISLPSLSNPLSTPTPSASDSGASASASGSANGGSSLGPGLGPGLVIVGAGLGLESHGAGEPVGERGGVGGSVRIFLAFIRFHSFDPFLSFLLVLLLLAPRTSLDSFAPARRLLWTSFRPAPSVIAPIMPDFYLSTEGHTDRLAFSPALGMGPPRWAGRGSFHAGCLGSWEAGRKAHPFRASAHIALWTGWTASHAARLSSIHPLCMPTRTFTPPATPPPLPIFLRSTAGFIFVPPRPAPSPSASDVSRRECVRLGLIVRLRPVGWGFSNPTELAGRRGDVMGDCGTVYIGFHDASSDSPPPSPPVPPSRPLPTSTTAATNHTGAIAGGVVGGVALLLLLAVLVWALLRRARERRKRAEFDGNFDPGRTTAGAGPTLPQLDGGGGRRGGRGRADAVHGRRGAPAAPAAAHPPRTRITGPAAGHEGEQAPLSPSTMSTSVYPASSSAHAGPHAGTASVSGGSSSGGYYPNPMSAKEREARGSGAFAVANPGSGAPQMGQMHMADARRARRGLARCRIRTRPRARGASATGSGVLGAYGWGAGAGAAAGDSADV